MRRGGLTGGLREVSKQHLPPSQPFVQWRFSVMTGGGEDLLVKGEWFRV